MAEITIKTIFAQESRSLGRIGRVGENLAREIVFDCAKVLEGNADAQIVCAIKRQGDAQPYTRPLTADGEGRYTLTLTAADVAKAGSVQLELRMVDGDAVLKTAIYTGIVSESIGSVGDVPGEPVTDALNRLESATKEAGTAASAALTAAEAAGNAAASTLAAEQERAAAEAERANSEQERVIAETERAAAEEARAEAFAGYAEQITAVTPDDTAIGARPWTSKKIVDALCMPLEESGSVVTCYPVEGYPLDVKQSFATSQRFDWAEKDAITTQSAAPSPDYPQPLTDSLPADEYRTPCTAPEGGYWLLTLDTPLGGVDGDQDAVEIDAYSGRYHIVRRAGTITLDGTEDWHIGGKFLEDGSDWYYETDATIADVPDASSVSLICDHYPLAVVSNKRSDQGIAILWRKVRVRWGTEGTIEGWKAQLAESPITIRYALAEPTTASGQAEHSSTESGTALNPTAMSLTTPSPDYPCTITGYDVAELNIDGDDHSDSYAEELPETVYGGTLDWNTGVLTVTRKAVTVDTVVNRHPYGDAGYAMYYPLSMADIATLSDNSSKCTHFKRYYAYQRDDEYSYVTNNMIYFFSDRWETLEDAQAWFAENKPRIEYELATPQTIQLTPRQILALAGENNIYANSGTVEVRGRTDPVFLTNTLMERIAALEAAAINA